MDLEQKKGLWIGLDLFNDTSVIIFGTDTSKDQGILQTGLR